MDVKYLEYGSFVLKLEFLNKELQTVQVSVLPGFIFTDVYQAIESIDNLVKRETQDA